MGRLLDQSEKLGQHLVDDEFRNPLDKTRFAGLQVENAGLAAQGDALRIRSGAAQRDRQAGMTAKPPPCVIGQTSGVPRMLKALAETIST